MEKRRIGIERTVFNGMKRLLVSRLNMELRQRILLYCDGLWAL